MNGLILAAAGFGLSLLPRALGRMAIYGPAIPTITVPQGATLKCSFTFKNTGYIRAAFQAKFWVSSAVGSNAWSLPIPGVALDPGATTTQAIYGSVRPDTPVGTASVSLEITDVAADGTPGTKIYDTSTGTINVVTGVAAEIISIKVEMA